MSVNHSTLATLDRWLGLDEFTLVQIVEPPDGDLACWCNHEADALPIASPNLDPLLRLLERLQMTFASPDAARDWMRAPNHALGGVSPVDLVRSGRVEQVYSALDAG